MIDLRLFLELMKEEPDANRLKQDNRPGFLDNCEIDENGVRAASIEDETIQILTESERTQLTLFADRVLLNFPCSIAEFTAWVKENGFVDLIEWSGLDDHYLTLKNIAKVKAQRPHPSPPLDEILSSHLKTNDGHLETLTTLYRWRQQLQIKINNYDENTTSDISIIEAKKTELKQKILEIEAAIDAPLPAISQARNQTAMLLNAQEKNNLTKPYTPKRRNGLHELIERVDGYLYTISNTSPTAHEVWIELKNNYQEHDKEEIIDEINETQLFWTSLYGNESSLKRSSFDKTLSKIRAKK